MAGEESDEPGVDIAELDVDEFLSGDFLNGSDGVGASGSEDEENMDEDEEDDDDDDNVEGLESEEEEEEDDEILDENAATVEEESSDDDDDSDGDVDGIGAQNARYKNEIEAHKAQLEKLKEADPEFYAYLADTDKELLAFGGGGDDDDDDMSEQEEEAEESEEEQEEEAIDEAIEDEEIKTAAAPERGSVTLAQVESWCSAALKNASLGAMRSLLRAYRTACHYGDSEDNVMEGMRLGSSAVSNRLMLFVLREGDGIFKRMLGVEQGEEVEAVGLSKLPRWKKVEPLLKSYVGNTLHLLGRFLCLKKKKN